MTDEVYIKIIPLTNSDHKIVGKWKGNPLQRLKVMKTTYLSTISQYIKSLVTSPQDELVIVRLLVSTGQHDVVVPQTLTIWEYFLMTHQQSEGEIRYTFISPLPQPHNPINPITTTIDIARHPQALPPIEQHYQPSIPSISYLQPYMSNDVSVFHTGYSLFSNAFNQSTNGMDSQVSFQFGTPLPPDKPPSEESISLKKQLESVINNKKC